MPTQSPSKKSSAKNQSTSPHRKERYAIYSSRVYPVNKLKRIIQSCGVKFARVWARKNTCEGVLAKLLK